MKLHAHRVAALHGRGEWFDVMSDCRGIRRNRSLIGMSKVDELAGFDADKKTRAHPRFEGIPTYMWNFFDTLAKAGAGFCKVCETRLIRRFARARIEPLHSHADSKEGYAVRNRCADRRCESGCVETFRGGKMTHARKDKPLRRFDRSGACRHFGFSA